MQLEPYNPVSVSVSIIFRFAIELGIRESKKNYLHDDNID